MREQRVDHGRWNKEHDLRFDVPRLVGNSPNREIRDQRYHDRPRWTNANAAPPRVRFIIVTSTRVGEKSTSVDIKEDLPRERLSSPRRAIASPNLGRSIDLARRAWTGSHEWTADDRFHAGRTHANASLIQFHCI